jgi:hypothetical protein
MRGFVKKDFVKMFLKVLLGVYLGCTLIALDFLWFLSMLEYGALGRGGLVLMMLLSVLLTKAFEELKDL